MDISPEVIKEHGDIRDWSNLVGTGPYELTDVVQGSSLKWTRVPNYWGFDEKFPQNRLPYIDEINALIMLESATRLAALRSGKVDMLGAFGDSHLKELDQVISLRKTNPEIELWPFRFRSSNAFAFNNVNNPPFNDIRVRQSMQMALDLETINETYFSGLGDATPHGFVDNSSMAGTPFDQWPEEVKKTYSYDPEGAEALLDEAGLPRGADGTRFKTILRPHPRSDANFSELATTYWREIGVNVELLVVADEGAYGAFYWDNRTDDMLTAVAAITYSALRAMHSFTTGGEWNPTFANDPEFDALWEAANTASTAEEQARWAKAANMYMTEQHWLLIGPVTPMFNVSQPWVKGYNGEIGLGTMQHGNLFARLWIDGELKEAMGY